MAQVRQSGAETLRWIKPELESSLSRIRQALEANLEAPEDHVPLQRALLELHQIRGSLSMVQCHGAVLLVEEMKSAVQQIMAHRDSIGDPAFEAMLGASLQLGDYIELLVSGYSDNALVFHPVVNELRVSGNRKALRESELFSAYMQRLRPEPDAPDLSGERHGAEQVVRQRIGLFQSSLLAWLRDKDVEASLASLRSVGEELAAQTRAENVYYLGKLMSALLFAVQEESVGSTLEAKRLCGQIGQQLKQITEVGEQSENAVSPSLLYQLLYLCGRSTSESPVVLSLVEAWKVQEVLPPVAELNALRERLRGPNTQLLHQLSGALKDDIRAAKDTIDLVIRAGEKSPADLAEAVETMKRVAQTLGMLGLDMLQRVASRQSEQIEKLREEPDTESEQWLDVAVMLLRIEHGIEQALFQHLQTEEENAEAGPAQHEEQGLQGPSSLELRQGGEAIHKECLADLSRAKTVLDEYIRLGQPGSMEEASRLFREIEGAVEMLGEAEAASCVRRLREYLQTDVALQMRDHPLAVERLAEAVSAVEYYIEQLHSDSGGAAWGLPDVEACLDAMESLAETGDYGEEINVGDSELLRSTPDAGEAIAVTESGSRPADTEVPDAATQPGSRQQDGVDPEIREVFLEEADEVMSLLREDQERWQADRADLDALGSIRRAFHTLKGSGRMVGAEQIGETAWAIEKTLNQCLEESLPVSDVIVELVQDAVSGMPQLIADFAAGREADQDVMQSLLDAAEAAAVQRSAADEFAAPEALQSAEVPEVPEAAGAAEAADPLQIPPAGGKESAGQSPDSEILRVYRDDAAQRCELLRAAAGKTGLAIDSNWVRALHSLGTGAKTVDRADVASVATAMEEVLESLRLSASTVDETLAALLADIADDIALRIGVPGTDSKTQTPPDRLLERIAEFRGALPDDVVALAERHKQVVVCTDHACDLLDQAEEAVKKWQSDLTDNDSRERAAVALDELSRSAGESSLDGVAELGGVISALLAAAHGMSSEDGEIAAQTAAALEVLYDLLDRARHGEHDAGSAQTCQVCEALRQRYSHQEQPEPAKDPDAALTDGTEVAEVATADSSPEFSAELAADDIDTDLLDIFTDEAAELLEALDVEHIRWKDSPESTDPRRAIQRLLHTLKGSARMAGAESIGDLSHELEGLIGEVEVGRRDPAGEVIESIREALDDLHTLLGQARKGDLRPDVSGNLSRLRGVEQDQPAEPPEAEAEETGQQAAETAVIESATGPWDPRLFWQPPKLESERIYAADETARVPVEQLDAMLNESGEVNIFRARLDQQTSVFRGQLSELQQTASRMREQLRMLESETDVQIQAGRQQAGDDFYGDEFDALEMDRYTRLNELSRALNETVSDLSSLHESMSLISGETETLLLQQGRVASSLQQGLMTTLMVPFARQLPRFERVIRQAAQESEKQARLSYKGVVEQLDRKVLERIAGPLEHLLRNAVVHGIEKPKQRRKAGKPEDGNIQVTVQREGSQVWIGVKDDGVGLDFDAIRLRAVENGLIEPDAELNEDELAKLIFVPGFSTAPELTQSAGRGVGMDVVDAEIKKLGGSVQITSRGGKGTQVTVRLPLSLALTHALLVRVSEEAYAVPLRSIEGVSRISRGDLSRANDGDEVRLSYGGQDYRVSHLSKVLAVPEPDDEPTGISVPVLLVRAGDRRMAFVVEAVIASREVVVKNPGPQVSSVPGITGATILPDGRVILIIDPADLVLALLPDDGSGPDTEAQKPAAAPVIRDERSTVMVVDDSITMRRVAQRLLERNGYRVLTARDGMDALTQLQHETPDVMLLDIEMPRVDGFELATYVRNSEHLRDTPIIMITSRGGQKHRERADAIGVNEYLVKPYQDQDMLEAVAKLVKKDD